MTNFLITIAYDGTRYNGWQRQNDGADTIQNRIERILAEMTGHKVEINGAGRTDAGVHAQAQRASFPINTDRTPDEIRRFLNERLPSDIAVTACEIVPERFHARLNAVGKRYCYRVRTAEWPDVFARRFEYQVPGALDLDAMRQAAALLCGTHDFRSFCGNKKMKKSTVRTVWDIEIREERGTVCITYHGSGFLMHMVRILSGTLLEVGQGVRSLQQVQAALDGSDRTLAGPTLPARGLTLLEVEYS